MRSVPVTILGGSDRSPGHLPRRGAGLHPLATYKGAAVRVAGRPLVAHLVERLQATEGFGPITVAGPAGVYGPLGLGVELIDTDLSLEGNFRAAVEHHGRTEADPLGILACDVLPTANELASLRDEYERAAPCALWFPFVRAPDDPARLGASAWKPVYRIVAEPDGELVGVLPGHLGIFQPRALRLRLLYRLLQLVYRTRNRSITRRRTVVLRAILFHLLGRDLGQLARLRAPVVTATVVRSGLRLARRLRERRLELHELETLIGRIFLHREEARPPTQGIRLPILEDVLSLALDVDTEEEVQDFVRHPERHP